MRYVSVQIFVCDDASRKVSSRMVSIEAFILSVIWYKEIFHSWVLRDISKSLALGNLTCSALLRDGSYVVSYKIRSIMKGFHRHDLESLDLKIFLPPQYQVQRIQNHFQKFHRCSILGGTASYYAVFESKDDGRPIPSSTSEHATKLV